MTGSMQGVDADEDWSGRPAPVGSRTEAVIPQPDVPQATVELDLGKDEEYADFFAAVLPQAVAVARRITGDLAAAEDAASEALAKAYLRWPKLRRLAYRDAWVLRVATNEAIATVRKQARRERILRRQPPQLAVAGDRDGADQLVVDQIRRLPNRQREVVALRFYADLSVNEVAAALGISAGSVKSHLHRAVHTLRDRLGTDILGGAPE